MVGFGDTDFPEKHHPWVAVDAVEEIRDAIAYRHAPISCDNQDIRTPRQKLRHVTGGWGRVSVWCLEQVNGVYTEVIVIRSETSNFHGLAPVSTDGS
jgi:hypothetical protein